MSALAAVVPGSAPYGAAELKAVYQRNFFVACCIAAVLHLAIIGSYAGWIRMHPETARLAGIECVVLVKLWVDTEGKVRQATVVRSTWEIFDEPALEAARQSVFRPAYMTGGAVWVWVTLPFRFRIRNAQ